MLTPHFRYLVIDLCVYFHILRHNRIRSSPSPVPYLTYFFCNESSRSIVSPKKTPTHTHIFISYHTARIHFFSYTLSRRPFCGVRAGERHSVLVSKAIHHPHSYEYRERERPEISPYLDYTIHTLSPKEEGFTCYIHAY